MVERVLMVLVMFGAGKLDLDAMAGRQMAGSSVIGWTVSCVMSRARWTRRIILLEHPSGP